MFWKKNKSESDKDIVLLKTQSQIDLSKAESVNSAKEVASKYIGKTAIPWIVFLVVVSVVSSIFLKTETLPAVIGLVSTAVMALITMLGNITGAKEKEEKPEMKIIENLIKSIDEPMTVSVDGEKIVVNKGGNVTTFNRIPQK